MTRDWMKGKRPCSSSVGCCYQFFLQQLSQGDWVTLDIVGMNCYAGSSLMLEKLFPRSRVAKLNKKKKCIKKTSRMWRLYYFHFEWCCIFATNFKVTCWILNVWPASELHRTKTHQIRLSQDINYVPGVNQAPLEAALTFLGHQDNYNWITASAE